MCTECENAGFFDESRYLTEQQQNAGVANQSDSEAEQPGSKMNTERKFLSPNQAAK